MFLAQNKNNLIYPSFAKLNLFLHITGKRIDGYHNLESVFITIKIQDEIKFIPKDYYNGQVKITFNNSAINLNNTISETLRLISKYSKLKKKQSLDIEIQKNIPLQSGLGGASSNAYTCLCFINNFWKLKLSDSQLFQIASQVGADVPYFILDKPCFVEGKGEKLRPITNFPKLYIGLFTPKNIQCSTKKLFMHENLKINSLPIINNLKKLKIDELIRQLNKLDNTFEPLILDYYPQYLNYIKNIHKVTDEYNLTLTPRFTGTGSTLFWACYSEKIIQCIHKDLMKNLLFKPNELIKTETL